MMKFSNYGFSYRFPENSISLRKYWIEDRPYREYSIYLQGLNLIEWISDAYILKTPNEIKRFLMANRDLLPILVEGYIRIIEIFGYFPIYLELHSDPEEEWEELFIVIKTKHPAEKALELEKALFEEWFVDVMDKVSGRLNFTEEPL